MKLLIITDAWHPQVNGVVRTYEYLVQELIKRGHEVKVIGPRDFPFTMSMPGYAEIKLALFPYRRMSAFINSFKPENIHIATEGPLGWAARRYCIKHKHNFTTCYHTHFPDYVAKRFARYLPFSYKIIHAISKAVVRRFHAPANYLLLATKSLEEELRSWGFKGRFQRFSRGVNLDLFYPGDKTVFKNLKPPIALYVGRVAIEKNIEAFLDMQWEGSKVIVGDGPSLDALKKKYPEAIFAGKKEGRELAEHYRSADIFVFPSKTDTFGIVLIEALASGLPVAAYNVTGPKDIITEDFLGALHEYDLRAACDLALRKGTPEQRTNFVKKEYTWENAADQYEYVLNIINE